MQGVPVQRRIGDAVRGDWRNTGSSAHSTALPWTGLYSCTGRALLLHQGQRRSQCSCPWAATRIVSPWHQDGECWSLGRSGSSGRRNWELTALAKRVPRSGDLGAPNQRSEPPIGEGSLAGSGMREATLGWSQIRCYPSGAHRQSLGFCRRGYMPRVQKR